MSQIQSSAFSVVVRSEVIKQVYQFESFDDCNSILIFQVNTRYTKNNQVHLKALSYIKAQNRLILMLTFKVIGCGDFG